MFTLPASQDRRQYHSGGLGFIAVTALHSQSISFINAKPLLRLSAARDAPLPATVKSPTTTQPQRTVPHLPTAETEGNGRDPQDDGAGQSNSQEDDDAASMQQKVGSEQEREEDAEKRKASRKKRDVGSVENAEVTSACWRDELRTSSTLKNFGKIFYLEKQLISQAVYPVHLPCSRSYSDKHRQTAERKQKETGIDQEGRETEKGIEKAKVDGISQDNGKEAEKGNEDSREKGEKEPAVIVYKKGEKEDEADTFRLEKEEKKEGQELLPRTEQKSSVEKEKKCENLTSKSVELPLQTHERLKVQVADTSIVMAWSDSAAHIEMLYVS